MLEHGAEWAKWIGDLGPMQVLVEMPRAHDIEKTVLVDAFLCRNGRIHRSVVWIPWATFCANPTVSMGKATAEAVEHLILAGPEILTFACKKCGELYQPCGQGRLKPGEAPKPEKGSRTVIHHRAMLGDTDA